MNSLPAPFQIVDSELSSALGGGGQDPEPHRLLCFAEKCLTGRYVADILSTICADSQMLEACAVKSSAHPLGFDKYLLHKTSMYEFRLHIWWPRHARQLEHIHNHRFSFVSGVLAGCIRVSAYVEHEGSALVDRFREERSADGSNYVYVPQGTVGVRTAGISTLLSGGTYFSDAGQLHRAQALGEGLVATIFIRFGASSAFTEVLVERGVAVPVSESRSRFTPEMVRDRLTRFAVAQFG